MVRGCLAEGRTDSLMRMLDDLLNYGLFPDDYALVLMLDHFLEAKNWRDACKVGREFNCVMLLFSLIRYRRLFT